MTTQTKCLNCGKELPKRKLQQHLFRKKHGRTAVGPFCNPKCHGDWRATAKPGMSPITNARRNRKSLSCARIVIDLDCIVGSTYPAFLAAEIERLVSQSPDVKVWENQLLERKMSLEERNLKNDKS